MNISVKKKELINKNFRKNKKWFSVAIAFIFFIIFSFSSCSDSEYKLEYRIQDLESAINYLENEIDALKRDQHSH